VVGLPDGTGDTMLKAFVVLQSGQTVTADELKEWCRDPRTGMAAYRVPKVFEFRESLPETIIGNVLRRVLLEEELKKIATG